MRAIKHSDLINASNKLGVDIPTIKAVSRVESLGRGFHSNGEPIILFERHKFHQFTNGKYSKTHPHISNPRAGGYLGGQKEHKRLQEAVKLNRIAALKSASWGKFQIMGFNYKLAGFSSLQSFINAMYKSEGMHLIAFVNFVKSVRLDDELRRKDWKGFARGYNGRAYYKNRYDTKLANAYKKYSKQLT